MSHMHSQDWEPKSAAVLRDQGNQGVLASLTSQQVRTLHIMFASQPVARQR